MEILIAIKFLILGWLFGLLSPQVVDVIKRGYLRKDIKSGLRAELNEVAFRLVCTEFLIKDEYGNLDRPFLKWAYNHLVKYEGDYPSDRMSGNIKRLSEKDGQSLLALSLLKRSQSRRALTFKKFLLPFLDSKVEHIALFDRKIQSLVFEIRAQLHILNEDIENAQFYFRLTFDSNISPGNFKIATQNLQESCGNISQRAHKVVEKMDSLKL